MRHTEIALQTAHTGFHSCHLALGVHAAADSTQIGRWAVIADLETFFAVSLEVGRRMVKSVKVTLRSRMANKAWEPASAAATSGMTSLLMDISSRADLMIALAR